MKNPFDEAKAKLQKMGEESLLQGIEKPSKRLLEQILAIDIPFFRKQKSLLQTDPKIPHHYLPAKADLLSLDPEKGLSLLRAGKAACLVIAGGMGTRLGWEGPKGCFPITLIRKKSLFQLLAERVYYRSRMVKRALPLAIMTSCLNEAATRKFFEENHFFGLDASQVDFLVQDNLPFLDDQGHLFLTSEGTLAVGPDGNGDALNVLQRSPIYAKWIGQGVEYLNIIPVDNALADPFDPELLGAHTTVSDPFLIRAIERRDKEEKLGILTKVQDRTEVIEYFEFPKEVIERGEFTLGYSGLFSVRLSSLRRVELPLHKSYKEGYWKFEKFIFDLFPTAGAKIVLSDRKNCFAPLKNRVGKDGVRDVQEALLVFDQRVYTAVTGGSPPNNPFELSPRYAVEQPQKLLPDQPFIE